LYKLNLRGCIDCDACEKKKPLVIWKLKEDFPEKLELAKASDSLIYSIPVYWNNVSAPMKAWFDRCNCMLYPTFRSYD
jgi:multimeric flavodoxin WrbA